MSTVIRDNGEMMKTLHIYNRNTTGLQKSMQKIASGMKISGAGDDPSNWAVTQRMRERISALDQANTNTQNDNSLMKVAESAISNTIEIIHTLRARAINSANDHNTDDERAVIQNEVEHFLWQIDNNAMTTYNGQRLLDGSKAAEGLNFHIGGEANFSVTLKLGNMTADALGLSGLDLSTREGAVASLGVDNGDGTYSPSKTVTDADGNTTTIYGMLDTALNIALAQQSAIGAVEERLGFTSENLTSTSENMQSAVSNILDADLAKEMSSYVKQNILLQAAQFVLSQMNKNAETTLDLLAPVQ